MANRVRRMIREEVGDGYFCILVDEAQAASKREQMAIILRFVNAKEVDVIWEFFSHLDNIINIITSFPKRFTELQSTQRIEIEHMLAIGERESGSGANQVGNIQRSGATHCSSHYDSIKSLIDMYNATCAVFENLSVHCPNGKSRGEVRGTYEHMKSFDFVFSLHLMHTIMRIIDVLCQALQRKSQDILTATRFVSTTTKLLHKLRDDDWEEFLEEVKKFCTKHDIEIPDLESLYKVGPCRSRDPITMKHHYHFDVFNEAIDYVLMKLNTRFNDTSVELLTLSAALDPRDSFASFNSHDICTLAEKFYPEDFPKEDIRILEYELRQYELDMKTESRFQVSTLVELCR
ncbi:uncharacterized protein LOC111368315 [Olea europaea var. sylvestris]|uniref:uncharacterized protein LOC111368315 n=1 Tax=Olea europaea var. sylvestris TaxID=158386 RepID=UPI000C1D4062|nr:uncharacterized protein LOC111368315 [Olea europaea var. sylvestris]